MNKIEKISIIHSVSRKYQSALETCLKAAKNENVIVSCVASINSKNILKDISNENSDLILVIGGDGTMISAIESFLTLEIPFLGINIGKLGFLTDIDVESIISELPIILKGDYVSEKRSLLEVSTSNAYKKAAVN